MAEPRFEAILAEATKRYPDRVEVALVEGLSPLARIALTARTARRALRFSALRSELARRIVGGAIHAAEKAASGEPITAEEEQAARDEAVRHACACEVREGGKASANVVSVARMAARCVYGPEIAYGEMFFLADFRLQRTVAQVARSPGLEATEVEAAVRSELQAL